jgi:hypothetical protein
MDKIPDDMNDVIIRMLDSVDSVYWEETSRIFQVLVAAGQALPLLSFDFLTREMDDEQYALRLMIDPYDVELSKPIYEEKACLNARCVDLLFVSPCTEASQILICFKVDFLHRTDRDFSSNTDALEHLIAAGKDIAPDEFDPLVSLCRMNLALSKTLRFPEEKEGHFLLNQVFMLADSLTYYASQVERRQLAVPQWRTRRACSCGIYWRPWTNWIAPMSKESVVS